jgi:translation elongation factor EF-1alpha
MSKIATRIELLTARIEKDTAELAELQLQRDAELALQNVQVGDVCTFKFGRKDNRQVLRGSVVADDKANGKLRVYAGEGFDAQLYTISVRDVLGVGADFVYVEEAAEEAADSGAEEAVAVDTFTAQPAVY